VLAYLFGGFGSFLNSRKTAPESRDGLQILYSHPAFRGAPGRMNRPDQKEYIRPADSAARHAYTSEMNKKPNY
jgi:hypothetical protein